MNNSIKANFFHYVKYLYPGLILVLILSDYNTFSNFLGFEIPYLKEILYDIDLFSFNIVILLILLPLVLVIIFLSINLFAEWLIEKLQEKAKSRIWHLCKYIFYVLLLYAIIFNAILISILWEEVSNEFLFSLLFVFIESLCSSFILIQIKNVLDYKKNDVYDFLYLLILSIPILLFIIPFIPKLMNIQFDLFRDSIISFLLLIFFLLFSYMSYTILNRKKINNKQKTSTHNQLYITTINNKQDLPPQNKLIVGILAVLLIVFISILSHNNVEWSKKINTSKSTFNEMSFNLIFNKELIIKNNADICVEIFKDYHSKLFENPDSENNIFYNKECETDSILPVKTNTKTFLKIDKEFFFLQVSPNIKLYFKNLFIEKEYAKKVFTGFKIYFIEEKKYGNSPGSEFTLITYKNKFLKDFDERIEILENNYDDIFLVELKLLENTLEYSLFKINKDKYYLLNKDSKNMEELNFKDIKTKIPGVDKRTFKNYNVTIYYLETPIKPIDNYYLPNIKLKKGFLIFNKEKQREQFHNLIFGKET